MCQLLANRSRSTADTGCLTVKSISIDKRTFPMEWKGWRSLSYRWWVGVDDCDMEILLQEVEVAGVRAACVPAASFVDLQSPRKSCPRVIIVRAGTIIDIFTGRKSVFVCGGDIEKFLFIVTVALRRRGHPHE